MTIYEFFNTSNQTSPWFERHHNFVADIRFEHCLVEVLEYGKRCAYIQETDSCTESVNFIDYVNYIYCTVNASNHFMHYVSVLSLLIMAAYMFIVLGETADRFFCPALTVLSKLMKMSENLAGVTLLAFGNGSPDIFTAIASASEDTAMQFSELYGAGTFITTMIAGAIIVIKPFKIFEANFLRDCLFYMIGLLWIDFAMSSGNISFIESSLMFIIYGLYLIVVIIDQILVSRESKKVRQLLRKPESAGRERLLSVKGELDLQGTLELRTRYSETSINVAFTMNASFFGESDGPNVFLFKQFFNSINPIEMDEWRKVNWFYRILMIAKAPIIFLLLLILPIIDYEADAHGWSKLLNSMQVTIMPVAVVVLKMAWSLKFFGVTIFAYILVVSVPFSIAVFLFSRTDTAPKFHWVFAIIAAVGSLVVISSFASEVVSVLHTIGIVFGLTPSFLGSTILAWGNSIGDLFANITLARQGYQRMGFAACYGGPLLNTLLGMGLVFLKAGLESENGIAKARFGSLGPNCVTFLMVSLSFTLISLALTRFVARKSIGIFLFIIYFLFLLYTILGEFEIIHPYGTDHLDQRAF